MQSEPASETWKGLSAIDRLSICSDFAFTEHDLAVILEYLEGDFQRFYRREQAVRLSESANQALILLEPAVEALVQLDDRGLAEVVKQVDSWLQPSVSRARKQLKELSFDLMLSDMQKAGRGARLTHGENISRLAEAVVASWSEISGREISIGSGADSLAQFLRRTLPGLRVLKLDRATTTPHYEDIEIVARDCLNALPLAVRRYRRKNP